MKAAPKQTYGTAVHEAKAGDGVGADRDIDKMDRNKHSAFVRFVGTEVND